MKILLLGGTGGTGSLFIDHALTAGHQVTAVVRPTSELAPRAGLHTIIGDARNADDLTRAGADIDVLVSTIGVGTARKSHNLLQDTMHAVTTTAQRTGLKRIVVQSAFGTGASYQKAPLLMRLGYHYGRDVFIDKEKAEQTLFDSDLDWSIVYPVVLSDAPGSGQSIATDLQPLGKLRGLPRVPRDDVAAFLLTAATDTTWTRRIAVLHPAKTP
jgi:uncharacterized protein YbjT (DUF2867 family)